MQSELSFSFNPPEAKRVAAQTPSKDSQLLKPNFLSVESLHARRPSAQSASHRVFSDVNTDEIVEQSMHESEGSLSSSALLACRRNSNQRDFYKQALKTEFNHGMPKSQFFKQVKDVQGSDSEPDRSFRCSAPADMQGSAHGCLSHQPNCQGFSESGGLRNGEAFADLVSPQIEQ